MQRMPFEQTQGGEELSKLTITVEVNAPGYMAQGMKERIAMDLERYGDVRVVLIKETKPEYKQEVLRG